MCFACRDVAEYAEAQKARRDGKTPPGARTVLVPASPKDTGQSPH